MFTKKNISLFVKVLVGIACLAIIYNRLITGFSNKELTLFLLGLSEWRAWLYLFFSVLLFPLNWGIESLKWKLITAQVQAVSFYTAQKSVYAGICVGNLAPGRATEFLAKIHFFNPENRLAITVLHFVNGMFQLSITITVGLFCLLVLGASTENSGNSLVYWAVALSILLLVIFVLALFSINKLVAWVYKKFLSIKNKPISVYKWSTRLLSALFILSLLRYAVFILQFYFLFSGLGLWQSHNGILAGIGVYFLLTTIIPMFSVIEPAIRAAIALLVFESSGMNAVALTAITLLIWIINIVLPSVVGYIILLREKLGLHSFKLKRKEE